MGPEDMTYVTDPEVLDWAPDVGVGIRFDDEAKAKFAAMSDEDFADFVFDFDLTQETADIIQDYRLEVRNENG